jgi:hypothetical protein
MPARVNIRVGNGRQTCSAWVGCDDCNYRSTTVDRASPEEAMSRAIAEAEEDGFSLTAEPEADPTDAFPKRRWLCRDCALARLAATENLTMKFAVDYSVPFTSVTNRKE